MAAQVHNLNCDTSDRDAEASARWSELYTRWLAIQAEWASPRDDENDEQGYQRCHDEAQIVLAMASTRCPRRHLRDKIAVFEAVLYDGTGSEWVDCRDVLLLASIKADAGILP